MSATLKVYAGIHESAGHVIYRINREFVKRAPQNVMFVDRARHADLQIVQCLGAGSLTKIWNDRFVLFQHSLATSDIGSNAVWRGIFRQALLVVAYADLPDKLDDRSFNFLLTPWGADKEVFREVTRRPAKGILSTGWSLEQEAIHECYLAAHACNLEMVNVGEDFRFGPGFTALSRITDTELSRIYNDCQFVSGLRYKEGFEVSVVEGLACGCRPICFDLPVYRQWFENLPQYVSPSRGKALVGQLQAILAEGARPLSSEEKALAARKFNWESITRQFWNKIFEYV